MLFFKWLHEICEVRNFHSNFFRLLSKSIWFIYSKNKMKNKTKQQNNETRIFRFLEFNNFANDPKVLKRFKSFRNIPAVQLCSGTFIRIREVLFMQVWWLKCNGKIYFEFHLLYHFSFEGTFKSRNNFHFTCFMIFHCVGVHGH